METVAKVVKKLQDYIGAVSNCVAAGAVECPAKGRTWRVVGRPAASGSGRQWRKVEHKARPYVSRNPFFKTPEGGAGCLTAVVVHLATRSPRVLSRVWRRNAGSRFWLDPALLYAPTPSPGVSIFAFSSSMRYCMHDPLAGGLRYWGSWRGGYRGWRPRRPAASGSGRQWRKVEHKARPYVSRNPFFKTPEGGAGCLTAVVVHLATRSPRVLSRVWRRNAGSRFWLDPALLYAPTPSPGVSIFAFSSSMRYCMHDPLNGGLHFRFSLRGAPFSPRGSLFSFSCSAGDCGEFARGGGIKKSGRRGPVGLMEGEGDYQRMATLVAVLPWRRM